MPGEVPLGEVLQHPPCLLVAAAGHQMFVLGRPQAVGEMDMPESRSPGTNQIHRLLIGRRGVREIQRQIVVVELGGIPSGHVRLQFAARCAPGIHVLDRDQNSGAFGQPPDTFNEPSGVVALPAKWRMDYDNICVEPARCLG